MKFSATSFFFLPSPGFAGERMGVRLQLVAKLRGEF
jgi:hypothetical protein